MSTIHPALKELGIQAVNPGGSTGPAWWSSHNSAPVMPSVNPATGETIAGIQPCAAEDYERIVNESQAAFFRWRLVPAPKRGEVVRLLTAIISPKPDVSTPRLVIHAIRRPMR